MYTFFRFYPLSTQQRQQFMNENQRQVALNEAWQAAAMQKRV
jgi:hypothetical protein